MNNEQQTWILKPGHKIVHGKDNDYEWTALVKPGEDVTTGFCSTISTTTWEKHFQPLDFSVLTRQVEDEIDYVMDNKEVEETFSKLAFGDPEGMMHWSVVDGVETRTVFTDYGMTTDNIIIASDGKVWKVETVTPEDERFLMDGNMFGVEL